MYNKRQELILNFIKDKQSVSREDIESFLSTTNLKTSKITVLRDLELLITDNLIEKSGQARATIYTLSASSALLLEIDIEKYFSLDQDERLPPKTGFNFDIFEKLENLLTAQEKEKLETLNNQYLQNKSKLSEKLLQKEYERLTVELAWKSSKIEGNTYTLLDTERLLKENVPAAGKTDEEAQMIINHKVALDFILDNSDNYKNLTLAKIEEIHCLLTYKLDVCKGIRSGMVGIIGTNYRPIDNSYQIKEALEKLVELINKIENPIEKALVSVLMISYIQPFEDGNKRTSRIIGNAILLTNNYCPLSYRSIDEIEYKKAIILFYETNNASYFKKLFIEQFKQAIEKYF